MNPIGVLYVLLCRRYKHLLPFSLPFNLWVSQRFVIFFFTHSWFYEEKFGFYTKHKKNAIRFIKNHSANNCLSHLSRHLFKIWHTLKMSYYKRWMTISLTNVASAILWFSTEDLNWFVFFFSEQSLEFLCAIRILHLTRYTYLKCFFSTSVDLLSEAKIIANYLIFEN